MRTWGVVDTVGNNGGCKVSPDAARTWLSLLHGHLAAIASGRQAVSSEIFATESAAREAAIDRAKRGGRAYAVVSADVDVACTEVCVVVPNISTQVIESSQKVETNPRGTPS